MKFRLVAGTINRHTPEAGWRTVHLDISPRPIYDPELDCTVQPEFVGSLVGMPQFRDGMFDEVRCHHVLEHLTFEEATHAVREVRRVLKPGGRFDVEVPDMDLVAHAWGAGEQPKAELQKWIHGEQLPEHGPGDSHRYAWDADSLRDFLTAAGFQVGDPEWDGLAVRYVAVKPQKFPRTRAALAVVADEAAA